MANRKRSTASCSAAPEPEADAIWLCPGPVALTAPSAAAALYAFSDLIEDQPAPTRSAVREELGFLVALHGTAMIEAAAEWLVVRGPDSFPVHLTGNSPMGGRPLADRFAWCRRQALSLLDNQDPQA